MTCENAAEHIRGRIREFRKRALINVTVAGISLIKGGIEMNMLPAVVQNLSPELVAIAGASTALSLASLGATFWRLRQVKIYENKLSNP